MFGDFSFFVYRALCKQQKIKLRSKNCQGGTLLSAKGLSGPITMNFNN